VLLIILRHQTYLTSTHTNCLIQLVKEQLVATVSLTEARILRCPHILSSVDLNFFVSTQPLALA
ncbi:MAG: hypothetical protein CFE50_20935, partial [Pseudomonas sp. PGPPP4]